MDSPCTSGRTPEEDVCPFVDTDKKNERCENCEARIKYAVRENMLLASALEQEEDLVVKEARKAVAIKKKKGATCSTPECDGLAKIKGKCQQCYGKDYYRTHHPKKEREVVVMKMRKERKEVAVCDGEMKPGCEGEVKARGKCQNCYRKFIRKYPDRVGKYRMDAKERRNQINLSFGKDDSEARQIIREVNKIAVIEMRRLSSQTLYFLREGIDSWKAEHPDG